MQKYNSLFNKKDLFLNIKPFNSGFTMMEVLVTVVIIGTSLVPILSMMIFSHRGTIKVSDMIIAQNLAIETMELYKNKDFETIVELSEENDIKVNEKIELTGRGGETYDTSGKDINSKPIITYPPDYQRFKRTIIIDNKQGQGTEATELKIITVKITWVDKKGVPASGSVELKSIVVKEDAI
jgi:prepilin-type N-terminal cleavage/methylation domain-containing protein